MQGQMAERAPPGWSLDSKASASDSVDKSILNSFQFHLAALCSVEIGQLFRLHAQEIELEALEQATSTNP
jgi:hypothetical protein